MNKYILKIVMVLFVFASFALAQKPDSIKTKKKGDVAIQKSDSVLKSVKDEKKEAIPKYKENKLEGFVDKNADGIDDRIAAKTMKGKGMNKGEKDKFIDRNGDGICDGRESAIGLKKTHQKRRGRKF